MTGVIFTAGISYALVFVMNLFLLGSLMGDLRASIGQQPVEMKAVARPAPEESEPDAKPDPDTPAAPQQKANPTTSVSASVAPDKASPAPQSKSSIAGLSLKGVVNSAKNPMAMIASGGKTYDVAVGESVLLEGASGKTKVTLESIEESAVVLNVAGEKVVLRR
jgi:Tfp pilus assembly protein PilP